MLRLSLSILLAFVVSGCGYTTKSLLPSNYKKIYVEAFHNKVNNVDDNNSDLYVPLLETKIRTAVIDRFLFDGNLKVTDSDNSDLVLTGDLLNVAQDTMRQDTNLNVQEYRIRIIVSLTLTEKSTGKVLWREPSFVGETTCFLTGTPAVTQSSAINTALVDLATRIVERTTENW
ncbi:MAG: hypothetical protein HQL13_07250 [Candidatus Omnitrophica bacterium]|nr:hypothetical protein [Candidatus Omnitrophota bacterium]